MSKSNTTNLRKKTKNRLSAKSRTATPAKQTTTPKNGRNDGAHSSSKIAAVVALLRRPVGASIEQIMAATGWQAHSVRGAISGAIKKRLGLTVTSEKTSGRRYYRVASDASV